MSLERVERVERKKINRAKSAIIQYLRSISRNAINDNVSITDLCRIVDRIAKGIDETKELESETKLAIIPEEKKNKEYAFNQSFKFMVPIKDKYIGNKLLKGELFEKYTIIAICSFLKSDGVFVDIGANLGAITIPVSRHLTEGKIYSFEPQTKIYDILSKNIALNSATNVTPIKKAVGHTETTVSLNSEVKEENGSLTRESDKEFNYGGVQILVPRSDVLRSDIPRSDVLRSEDNKTQMITLDSLDLKKVDVIKCDIEGAEPLAFYGARETITKFKPVIIYEKNYQRVKFGTPADSFDILDFCQRLGYKTMITLPMNNYMLIFDNVKTKIEPYWFLDKTGERGGMSSYVYQQKRIRW